jgi:hypothetical protein
MVISNARVLDVYWGNNVDATIRQRVPAQLDRFLSPMYMGWLDADYNTVFPGGTQQRINPGVWSGARTIQPTHTSSELCKGDVEDELRYQASIGALGYVDGNSAVMVHFPPGVKIHAGCFWGLSWDTTCEGICGFHDATSIGASNVPYAVLPDLSAPGCGCTQTGTADDAFTMESHELFEMVTDPFPHQQATWQDDNGDEIGDICNWLENDLPGGAVASPVPVGQAQWSNAFHACVPYVFAASGERVQLAPGASAYIGLSSGLWASNFATPSLFYYWLSSASLPNGVTLQFLDPQYTLDSPRIKLTAAPNALPATSSVTAFAWAPTVAPANTYSIPLSVQVTCAAGSAYCYRQNACIPAGTACGCAAGLQLCVQNDTCVANTADPNQCPQPAPAFDCSICPCGCDATGMKCKKATKLCSSNLPP